VFDPVKAFKQYTIMNCQNRPSVVQEICQEMYITGNVVHIPLMTACSDHVVYSLYQSFGGKFIFANSNSDITWKVAANIFEQALYTMGTRLAPAHKMCNIDQQGILQNNQGQDYVKI